MRRLGAKKKPFYTPTSPRSTRKIRADSDLIPILDDISTISVLPGLLDEATEKDFDIIDLLKKENYIANPVEFGV